MIHLDRAYIPTLFFTAREDTTQSREAIVNLQIAWERFNANHYRDYPDSAWRNALEQVGGLISRADGLLNTGDKTETAHEALEEVRVILRDLRRSYALDIFSDHLTDFNEALESIVQSETGATSEPTLTDSTLSALREKTTAARELWKIVDTLTIDTSLYGMTPAELGELRRRRNEVTDQLDRLNNDLLARNKQAFVARAIQIKALLGKMYTFLGEVGG